MWKWVPCHEGALGKSNFLGWKIETVKKNRKRKQWEKDRNWQKQGKVVNFGQGRAQFLV